mmetsp:Transcript_23172/g.51170  ORF Transcript_23172/g.51170 Transcript_23172/m.51170 type:complete len:1068 (+) Transcript_23172:69-3272(+)
MWADLGIGRASSMEDDPSDRQVDIDNNHLLLSELKGVEARLRDDILSLRQDVSNAVQLDMKRKFTNGNCIGRRTSGGDSMKDVERDNLRQPTFGGPGSSSSRQLPAMIGLAGLSVSMQPEALVDSSVISSIGRSPTLATSPPLAGPSPVAAANNLAWKDWPANLPLRSEYTDFPLSESMSELKNLATAASDRLTMITGMASSIYELASPRRGACSLMVEPESPRRLSFDVMSMFVLIFDLVYTPYSLTWSVPDDVGNPVVLATTTFWLTDMCLSLLTGYHTSEGHVEMRFKQVVLHYLRSWFAVDCACVVGDIINIFPMLVFNQSSGSSNSLTRLLRVAKLARFLRVLGMVRMLRIMAQINTFMEAELSEVWRMMVKIFQISALLLWLGHCVACGWWSLGKFGSLSHSRTGERWVDTYMGLEQAETIDELGPAYQYVVAYHWGLAQITLGAHDVNPLNVPERIYTISCNLFGLLFGGTLISVLSATLLDLKEMNQEREMKMRQLREFLSQHQVKATTRILVLGQVQDRIKQRETILTEKDVSALEVLSHHLMRELRFGLFSPHVQSHMLFQAWTTVNLECLKHLCMNGVEFLILLPDDELFSSGMPATTAYHVMKGKVIYQQDPKTLDRSDRSCTAPSDTSPRPLAPARKALAHSLQVEREPGSWISEAAWWLHWWHVGAATSEAPTTLLTVTPEAVLGAMSRSACVRLVTLEYGRTFFERLQKSAASEEEAPTDVYVHDFSELVFYMRTELHMILGMAALEHEQANRSMMWLGGKLDPDSSLEKLQKEIKEGQSVVLLDKDGKLQRQALLTLLELDRGGEVLAEIAQFEPDSSEPWHPKAQLPGLKMKFGEGTKDTLKRILQTRLESLQGSLGNGHEIRKTKMKSSSTKYGIGTTYHKSIVHANCEHELEEHLSNWAVDVDLNLEFAPRSSVDVSKIIQPLGSGRAMRAEDISRRLAEIREVYLLRGSTHTGIYAFIEPAFLDALNQHEDILTKWVRVLAACMRTATVMEEPESNLQVIETFFKERPMPTVDHDGRSSVHSTQEEGSDWAWWMEQGLEAVKWEKDC